MVSTRSSKARTATRTSPKVRNAMAKATPNKAKGKAKGSAQKSPVSVKTPSKKRALEKKATAIANKKPKSTEYEFAAGDVVVGRVDLNGKSPISPSLCVRLTPHINGCICITHIHDIDEWKEKPLSLFKNNQFVSAKVLSNEKCKSNTIQLSLRKSIMDSSQSLDEELAEATKLPAVGDVVKGFVIGISKSGCFVRLSRRLTGRVVLKELADHYVENLKNEFPTGKQVSGRVLAVDKKTGQVDITLKPSIVVGEKVNKWTWETLKKGLKLAGRVRTIASYGVFIDIDESANLSGLCHISEVSDDFVKDLAKEYQSGDRVKVYVISVDAEKKRISLGLKASYFEDGEDGSEDDAMSVDDDEAAVIKEVDDDSDSDSDVDLQALKRQVLNNDSGSDSDSDEDEVVKETEAASLADDSDSEAEEETTLSLQNVLKNMRKKDTAVEESDNESEDDVDATEGENHKLSSRRKKQQLRAEEALIAAKEQELTNDDAMPQTVEDYERLLVTQQDSSLAWLNYMAFLVTRTEFEQAAAIAERALRTINYRREEEKQNVWIAYLNLLLKHDSDKAFLAVFKRFQKTVEPKVAYITLATIYSSAGLQKKAEEAHQMAIKATKSGSKRAYSAKMEFYFDAGKADEARVLLKDALSNLPKRKHVALLILFSRFEFTKPVGDKERGRTLLEGLVNTYPKRTDIWHQYIDVEVKLGVADKARQLFQRVTSIKTSAKRMKAFFKKWLLFEQDHGTEDDVDLVKVKATEFVQSLS